MRTFLLVVVCLGAVCVNGAVPASSYKRKITTQSPETTTTVDTTTDMTTIIPPQEDSASTVAIPMDLSSNRVRRRVPASSYVRTEEGQKVAIPGLEAETTTVPSDMDAAIGEVFGETTPAQENGTIPQEMYSSPAPSSEASTQKSTTTLKPTTETPKVTVSSTSEKPTSDKTPDLTSTIAPSSSSEKSHQNGASFGFSVNIPTLPPADKIKIPNPFGFLG